MKNILIILIILLAINPANLFAKLSGQAKIDSLIAELPNANGDTNHVKLLDQLSFGLYSTDPDKGIEYGLEGLKLSKEIGWKKGEAKCYNSIGINYSFGKYDDPQALKYYHRSLKIYEELGNKRGVADLSGNIGLIYQYQSDYPQALKYSHRSLKVEEELGNKRGIASLLNLIGLIYSYQSDYPQALEYYHRSLKMSEELGEKRDISGTLHNIGIIYKKQSDYSKALEYFQRSLKIEEELENKSGIAISLVNIGVIYSYQSDNPKALEYFQRSLKIKEELGDKREIANSLLNIGAIYIEQNDYSEALEYYHRSLMIEEELGNKRGIANTLGNMGHLYFRLSQDSALSNISVETELVSLNKVINLNKGIELTMQTIKIFEEIGELDFRSKYLESLAYAYKQKGDYKNQAKYLVEYMIIKDSVFNQDKSKELGKLEGKYEAELAQKEAEAKEAEETRLRNEADSRRDLLQFSGITIFTIIIFAVIFFASKKNLSFTMLDTLSFLAFLLIYEFILVFADPYIDVWSSGEPIYKLAMNFSIALVFIPIHRIESKFKNRLKTSEDNIVEK